MSIQHLCSTIEELFPELNNQGIFSFYKNFIKNIKKEHVYVSLYMTIVVGGLYTLFRSSNKMRIQLKYEIPTDSQLEKTKSEKGREFLKFIFKEESEDKSFYSFLNLFSLIVRNLDSQGIYIINSLV